MPNGIEVHPDLMRLWSTLMTSAEIGATPRGGLRRLALTEEDGIVRRLFVQWCEEAGCAIKVDAVGNTLAIRPGTDPDAKPVLVGSHLDTQVRGGRFDGVLGAMAALEIIRTLNDHNVATRHPIGIVNWTNEEGARFEPPMLGSAVFTGSKAVDYAYARRDRDGVTFGSALDAIGFKGRDTFCPDQFDSFFELHIEQGPKLEAAKIQVGIVTGAFSVRGFVVEVTGETAHVGPTPMVQRRNAIVGASRVALAVDEIGWAHEATGGKSTTVRMNIEPNLLGIIPDRAEMTCDFRHPDEAVATAMFETFKTWIPVIEGRSRCRVFIREDWRYGGTGFDPTCIELLREASRRLGYPTLDMLTEAGHDALTVKDHLPTGLIFVPCEKGVSHNEAENVSITDIEPGINVLLHAVLDRAKPA